MVLSNDQIIIPAEKITRYLLVFKERNDKSRFLSALGFEIENWQDLAIEIADLATKQHVTLKQITPFGELYAINGILRGREVATIWMVELYSDKFRFVTLYPLK